ncbi:MAG: ABC-type amino acid transport substrate-binding protein [Pseudomonas sp.]|jgi:ABC-type amino acid transport substrate-binding protein
MKIANSISTNTRWLTMALLAGLMSNSVSADQLTGKLEAIAASKTILVGHQMQSIPFSFAETDGQPLGYSIDLCKRVISGIQQQLKLAKLEIKWIPLTLENRFNMVASGKVDMECGTSTNTISRQKIVDFSLMTWVDGGTFVIKKDSPATGLIDMGGKKIGVVTGNSTEKALRDWLKKNAASFAIVPMQTHLDGMKQLHEGLIDAYAADQTILIGLAASVREQMPVKLASSNFSYEPYALTLPRNDADFKQAVNRELAQLYRTGEVLKIYEKWFGQFGKPPTPLLTMYGMNALPE